MKGISLIPPVFLTATYQFNNSDELIDVVQNRSGFIYSRWDNPSVLNLEKEIAKLEGYECALGFSSGMAAITNSIFANIEKENRIVAMREVYGGTYQLLYDFLPRLGIKTVNISCNTIEKFFIEIEEGLSILYLETPTNPLLRVVDIKPLVEAAHKKNAIVILDSTFASPINQHPKNFGVDVVIHSATKYLGGHHDITGGFCCCNKKIFEKIWEYRKIFGGIMDPMTAFLTLRGIKTLELRIEKQNKNAMMIAKYLDLHKNISAVHYPGLPSHPDHEIAKKQMSGFGGMLSFEVKGDFYKTKIFMDNLKMIKLATSLGGVTSIANQPITNTHSALNPEERSKAGIKENLVRLSVGIENENDLINDLNQALLTF